MRFEIHLHELFGRQRSLGERGIQIGNRGIRQIDRRRMRGGRGEHKERDQRRKRFGRVRHSWDLGVTASFRRGGPR